MNRPPIAACAALFALSVSTVGATMGSLAGCSSCGQATSGTKATREDISLMPRETNFVIMANVARVRGTAQWTKILKARDESEQKAKLDEFVLKTGLDPFKSIDSAFAGFPTTKGSSEFGLIVRGGPFDEKRIMAYLGEKATAEGNAFTTSVYNKHTLYTDKTGQTFGTFLDSKTIVIGGAQWTRKIVDLADKAPGDDSATKNEALVAIVKKTRTSDAVWGAGLVPDDARTALKSDPRLASASTMKDVYASIDVQAGFALAAAIDLATEADARELAKTVNEQLTDAKRNPQVLMIGMGQFLDAIKVASQAAAFTLDVKLTQPQVDDLIQRLQGLLKTFGGALGGGGDIQVVPPPTGAPGSDDSPKPLAPAPSPPSK